MPSQHHHHPPPPPPRPQTTKQNIPTTPQNQKTTSNGPIPTLIQTIRADNHDQLTHLLTLDPYTNLPTPPLPPSSSTIATSGGGSSTTSSRQQTTTTTHPQQQHRQRLIFATESLRTLLLYHVLPDPSSRSSTKPTGKPKKPRKLKSSPPPLTPEEEALGLTAGNSLGIVGTRILLPSLHTVEPLSSTTEDIGGGDLPGLTGKTTTTTTIDGTTTETIYSPSAASPSPEGERKEDDSPEASFDRDRDIRDGASVILYFLYPTPSHIRAVCRRIERYRTASVQGYGGAGRGGGGKKYTHPPTPVVRHRIVFLPRDGEAAKRILSDENIVSTSPSPSPSPTTTTTTGGPELGYHPYALPPSLHHHHHNISTHTLDIDLIPLEDDVLTCLELPSLLRDVNVDGVVSESVSTVARSLVKIQDVVGVIGRVQSFGELGEMVVGRMMAMRVEDCDPFGEGGGDGDGGGEEGIAAMMVMDRKVDMVTPMLTPLTYEGLLDDVLKIDSGLIKVSTDIIDPQEDTPSPDESAGRGKQPPPTETERPSHITLPLNDMDTLYTEVRDQHVEKFGTFLQNQAKALKDRHTNFSDKNKDLTELHQFVKQIPIFTQSLKSLENHIHLAELVKKTSERSEFRQRWQTERAMVESEACYDVLEDLIASQYPPFRLLRLLCLQSLTGGGLKASKFDSLRREVVQTYGYEYLFVIQNLEKLGLLKKRESMWMETASPFTTIRKQFVLINADVDPLDPNDVSFVSSGYAPISARIVQTAIKGWSGKEEALKHLPGRGIDIRQRHPPEDFATALKRGDAGPSLGVLGKQLIASGGDGNDGGLGDENKDKPVLLVYFVGGVTYMEIAAMRFLSKRPSFPYSILCCTTKIINGSTLLQSLS